MPSTRPCAAFEPISPNFVLKALVESTPNFEYAVRIHSDMIEHHGVPAFERLVLMHVILGGKPLIVEGYDTKLDSWIFHIQWLKDNCGDNVVDARDLTKQANVPMSIGHYLKHMSLLTNQWTSTNYKDPERQRMYLKDIDCPKIWKEGVAQHIPPFLFYLNDSTGEYGGMGAVEEPDPTGSGVRRGRGIAWSGDLMSSLPPKMRAENLMCYIGHEGTYTPAHREMCASLGHNIMVEASTGGVEDGGQKTKPGSSIWFMTETKEREVVAEYWLSRLGHDIEVEKHFAQVNAWKNAPFKVYVVDQRPGDFILIPPLAPHQVWNRGTRTMKVAWNRTTVETLEMAMNEALNKARMVCRDEQYKNKAIVLYTMEKYAKLLQSAEKLRRMNPTSKRVQKADQQVKQLGKDFKRLHALFTRLLVEESFYPDRVEKKVEKIPYEGQVICSYCRCNIFNRFLTCPSCIGDLGDGEQDTYDICLECYAMGRSCACISKLRWVQQWNWGELVQKHDQWRHLIIQHEGSVNEKSPKSLKHELEKRGKKRTTAQICQTELLKRPFRDITKPPPPAGRTEEEEDIQVDQHGKVLRKKVKKKSEKFMREHGRCHVDCYWEPLWKQAQCSKCQKNYCYGILFRAYDMMPQDVLADPEWKCPACQNICNCRSCRSKPGWKRYTPKGTLLGHNTKAVADPRSVESLVDFSFSNIQWIKKADDDYNAEDTRRLQRRRKEANAALNRDVELGDNYVDHEHEPNVENSILRLAEQEGISIDPALGADLTFADGPNTRTPDEDEINENPEEATGRTLFGTDGEMLPLPDGGVVQDVNYPSYDQTDMITFTYPDPLVGQLPPPVMEGYQEAAQALPYAEADPPSPGGIEMVERKRKRKLDKGDRAFHLTNNNNQKAKATSKKRQSLVVRLAISRDKLQEIDKLASVAQAALSGVAVSAPVVSSDLRALNVHPNEDAQPPAKRVRREERPPPVEVDDEYAPHRSRDRRKGLADGESPLTKDDHVERRTTRMQNVTYAEPDEEEFNEFVAPKSKLATMELANDAEPFEAINDESSDISDDNEEVQVPTTGGKRPALTTPAALAPMVNTSGSGMAKPRAAASSPTASRPSTSGSTTQRNGGSNSAALEAQALANRRAKMAMLETENMSDLDEWSADESDATPEIPDNIGLRHSAPVTSNQTMNKNIITSTTSLNKKNTVQYSSRSTSFAAVNGPAMDRPVSVSTSRVVQAASAYKAAADDWGDSDSD